MPEMTYPWAGSWAESEMVEGYLDGCKADNPEPSENRSRSYRHGFANGRDDFIFKKPRDSFPNISRQADEIIAADNAVAEMLA